MKKVLLCGYMASGKTTTGRVLSEKTGLFFYDLDNIIEQETGQTISQLFSGIGEIGFRKLEHRLLNDVVNRQDSFILSLGGGTPCYANNHEVLQRKDVTSIYLKAGIPSLIERIENDKAGRPLLENLDKAGLYDFVAQHIFERSYFYHMAKYILNTDGKNPALIADEIIQLL